ncbi:MAG: penicillin-binding protein [Desulfatiglandaceae bacterium]
MSRKKWIRIRVYAVACMMLTGFGIVLARAFQLQVIEGPRLRQIAANGIEGVVKLPSSRGSIYDRDGHELAVSVDVKSIYADPLYIQDRDKTAREVSRTLEEPEKDVRRLLERGGRFVWIKRKIPAYTAGLVQDLNLSGIGVISETKRFFPGKEIGGHLIGFVGSDGKGLEGLEKKYDDYLRGPQETLLQMRDARRRTFAVSRPDNTGRKRHDLYLTIDDGIQYKAQTALRAAVEASEAKAGTCVVLDPQSGEILAMATVPEYNPNSFGRHSPSEWRNRVVTDVFEPGSTIKPFILAAALNESVVTPSTPFYCERGSYRVGRHIVHDTHDHETLTAAQVVIRSSNIGAIKLGRTLGHRSVVRYLEKFGFGTGTGIGILGERNGFVRGADSKRAIEQATLCFGQGMTATILQLAVGMASLANGGTLMKPYVVARIVDEDGNIVFENRPRVVRRVVSQPVARTVSAILEGVVSSEGTAPQAAIDGYCVAGKTGTSQKVDPKTKMYSKRKYMSTFVGFTPLDTPKLLIAVAIDEPKGSYYGGVVSAPVFKEVGSWALAHLRVSPGTHMAGSIGRQEPVWNQETLAKIQSIASALREQNITAGAMPDFCGMGLREVFTRTRELGVLVEVEGSGFAVSQEPSPGTPIEKGITVKVQFESPA